MMDEYTEDFNPVELEAREARLRVELHSWLHGVPARLLEKRLPEESIGGYLGSGLFLDSVKRTYKFNTIGYDVYGMAVAHLNIHLEHEDYVKVLNELRDGDFEEVILDEPIPEELY